MKCDIQNKIILSLFVLIILTIIIYKIFHEYKFVSREYAYPDYPEPPKSSFNNVEDWGFSWDASNNTLTDSWRVEQQNEELKQNLKNTYDRYKDRSKWLDDTITTFLPNDSFSSLTAENYGDAERKHIGVDGEQLIEGFDFLGDFGAALGEFIVAFICIILTLPIHILEFIIALFFLLEAFFVLVIGFVRQVIKIFHDFNSMAQRMASCGMTWSKNMRFCGLWYILELIGYVIIVLFVWLPTAIVRLFTLGRIDLNSLLVSIFGVKGSGFRDTNGNVINRDGVLAIVSKKIKHILGFDFLHFPPNVQELCYSCNIIDSFFQIIYDLTVGMMAVFQAPLETASEGLPWLWRAFYLDAFANGTSFCTA